MVYAALMMIGGTFFVNGLVVLEQVSARSAAPFNLFTGVVGTAVPFYLLGNQLGTSDASYDVVLGVAPMWLFAVTFLWVGIDALMENDTTGCGWYCLWVAALAVVFSLVNFIRLEDPRAGVIWLNWGYVWALFWVLLASRTTSKRVAIFTGVAAVLQALWSVTLQALLNMLGVWTDVSPWVFYAATVLTLAAALLAVRRCTVDADPGTSEASSGRQISVA